MLFSLAGEGIWERVSSNADPPPPPHPGRLKKLIPSHILTLKYGRNLFFSVIAAKSKMMNKVANEANCDKQTINIKEKMRKKSAIVDCPYPPWGVGTMVDLSNIQGKLYILSADYDSIIAQYSNPGNVFQVF
jgi:hypothetical protein